MTDDVERADVDAELERVGRDDSADRALTQTALDLAAPVRQVAAAVAADHIGGARRSVERILQVGGEDLGRQPALREEDELQVVLEELERTRRDSARYDRRMPSCGVHDRRIDEQEELLAARRAALLDQLERTAGQSLRELARIGDRRRRADEDRIRSVVAADALQPPQDVRRGGCRKRRDTRAARR